MKPKIIKGTRPPVGKVRLTINLPAKLHIRLLAAAIKRGQRMTDIIVAGLKREGVK